MYHPFLNLTCRIASTLFLLLTSLPLFGATYYVDQTAAKASDSNPGTQMAPWKTISRATRARDLRPGDTVLIGSGVYREQVGVTVSGEPGRPMTLAAAPGARVVIKGSELVRGQWTRLAGRTARKEPYPGAFSDIWKVTLGDDCFTDARFQGSYQDRSKRWVSQVFLDDEKPLQRIGLDPIYTNDEYLKLTVVGRTLDDMVQDSFFFEPATATLYLKMAGEPGWFSVEVGVRGFTLLAEKVHDVVLRGLEFRHNRQPGGQWPMAALNSCERVIVENCRFSGADFCGLSLGRSRQCVVRGCDLSHNGNTGLGLGECQDCLVENCTLFFNNYRRFHAGWHAGGMKCIPRNTRCTIRGCEAAYNIASDGIWFDAGNTDIRILSNISHHNDGCGIFFEINKGGGVIADNLVYGNRSRGIYISGSQNTWVVHNTVACNNCGIVAMPRGDDWPLHNVHILNNLLIRNYVAAETVTRGCDLTLFMGCPDSGPRRRTVLTNHSDYNSYVNTGGTPTLRHSWNPDNTLARWQQDFQEDRHSIQLPLEFELQGTGFLLKIKDRPRGAGALPDEVRKVWSPHDGSLIGSQLTRWPGP